MKTLNITKADLDKNNNYIGSTDVSNFDGNIEIAENLETVKFKAIKVTGEIYAKYNTGIKAGGGIVAGYGIEAGDGIVAGFGIVAGHGIKADGGIVAGKGIVAGHEIEAKTLNVRYNILAGTSAWLNNPVNTITVEKLLGGTIAYGKLVIKK